ncbi:2OG-Fe(II) oxygenase [Scytonema sp. NUACC26]|uniref:2OG-Fe(II) oxygenase n=1 Tax=Scytonema sp. NUACC26 TaxID=3140176 RepID=UPI0034DCB508
MTIATQVRNQLFKNLYEMSFVKNPAELEYQFNVKNHTKYLPNLSTTDRDIVDTLNTEGVVITSLEALSIPSSSQMFEAAKNLMPKIPTISSEDKSDYVVHATSKQIMESREIFLWGLEQRLLNIVENYLGLPVAYHGTYFRRDIANNIEKKSRLWHIDSEDRKLLKIIVYLNDINEENGPFQYIPQSLTPELTHALRYKHGYLQDKTMERVISPSNYISCTGSAGTIVFAGTASVFHRGKIPVASDRFAVFYDYTSRQPKFPFYCKSSLPEEDLVLLSSQFSEQHKQCVFWRK